MSQIHLENVRQIEGIFYSWLNQNENPGLSMCVGGGEIFFSFEGDKRQHSKPLDRDLLVQMDIMTLTKVIINSLNEYTETNAFKFPSRFNHYDKVLLNFGSAGQLSHCTIRGVHFYDGKVKYDVEISGNKGGDSDYQTRVYNVDSCFVSPAE